jgi:PAS domain S-box-containing protein
MRNYWSRLPTIYRGAIVLSIPTLCLLITLGAWVWSWERETDLNQQINRSEKAISQSNGLLIALLNAETGVRGYNISRIASLNTNFSENQRFLEPYQTARNTLPTVLSNLEQLATKSQDDTGRYKHTSLQQQQELAEIKRLSWQVMQLLENRKNLTTEQLQSFQLNSSLQQGKELMDRTRMIIAHLQTEQHNLLDLQQQRLKQFKGITSTVQWLAALVSAIAYIAAMCLFKTLEQDLSVSKTLIQAIVSNVVDGIITLNKQGEIETFNQAAAKMFGYEPDEVIGKSLTMLLTECLENEHQEKSSSQTNSQANFQTSCNIELNRPWQTRGNRKVGQPFPIEISLSKMEFNNHLIAIIRDISERQQAKENLQVRANELARLSKVLARTNEELGSKNQELEQFAYVTSHDLKAPLRAIANLSEWIEEDLAGQLPAENQRQMTLLRRRVYRLEALINGLLEYYRAGRTKVTTQTVDLNLLLAEIIDSLDPPATLKIEIEPGMPTLQTKKLPLSQVFSNLISNAIKYHPRSDGHIKISAQEREKFYEFAVADDGLGIAPEHQDKIFTIFQTLQSSDQIESTGIGLAIVKKIIETEGGEISLESQLGEGATFRFTWLKKTAHNYSRDKRSFAPTAIS